MTAVTAVLGRRARARRVREALPVATTGHEATTLHEDEGGPDGETLTNPALAPCWEDAARVQLAMVGMYFRQ